MTTDRTAPLFNVVVGHLLHGTAKANLIALTALGVELPAFLTLRIAASSTQLVLLWNLTAGAALVTRMIRLSAVMLRMKRCYFHPGILSREPIFRKLMRCYQYRNHPIQR